MKRADTRSRSRFARIAAIGLLALVLPIGAQAYELRLVATTSTVIIPFEREIVSYDLFLDTRGQSGISGFSASLQFDPFFLRYEPGLSDANDYYPLYAPGVGKSQPATWLTPLSDPPALWSGAQPLNGDQVITFDFVSANLPQTYATATNQYLATVSFAWTGNGSLSGMLFGFDVFPGTDTGAGFHVLGLGDVASSVTTINTGSVVTLMPEPTTALLVGLGLAALGVHRRRTSAR